MNTSESVIEITKALGAFQKECPKIKKDSKGYGYNYASFDSIMDSVKPLLLRHGIVIIQSVSTVDQMTAITTRLQHANGEYIQDTFCLPATQMKNVNNVQAVGASITYGKRYGLSAMLAIATEDDTDGVHQQPQAQTQNYQRRTQ